MGASTTAHPTSAYPRTFSFTRQFELRHWLLRMSHLQSYTAGCLIDFSIFFDAHVSSAAEIFVNITESVKPSHPWLISKATCFKPHILSLWVVQRGNVLCSINNCRLLRFQRLFHDVFRCLHYAGGFNGYIPAIPDTYSSPYLLYLFCTPCLPTVGLSRRPIWAIDSNALDPSGCASFNQRAISSLFHSYSLTTRYRRFTMRSPCTSSLGASPDKASSLSPFLPCTASYGCHPVLMWEMIFSPM